MNSNHSNGYKKLGLYDVIVNIDLSVHINNDLVNQLVDKGNTIIIIEHNLDVIKQVDHIIDIGPESGKHGGRLIDSGSPKQIIKNNKGYTATYLSKEYN